MKIINTQKNVVVESETQQIKTDVAVQQDAGVSVVETEIGGRKQGLEPTRYGDWEKNGRCIDF